MSFLKGSRAKIILFTAILIPIIFGFLVFLFDYNSIRGDFLYNINTSLLERERQQLYGCNIQTDCVLVRGGWCGTVLAINKNNENDWKKEDVRQTERARQNRQTCKPTVKGYTDISNFSASCEQSRCIAKFTAPEVLETSPDTYNEINPKAYGLYCELAGTCNSLAAINCQAEVDGPFYYVEIDTGEIVGRCGGLCMGGGCDLSKCPPKEWTCN